jgi:hypothetical protein
VPDEEAFERNRSRYVQRCKAHAISAKALEPFACGFHRSSNLHAVVVRALTPGSMAAIEPPPGGEPTGAAGGWRKAGRLGFDPVSRQGSALK